MSDRPRIHDVCWSRLAIDRSDPPPMVVPPELNTFGDAHSKHPDTTCFEVTRPGDVWWCYPESGVGDYRAFAIYDLEGELVGYRSKLEWVHVLSHPMGRAAAADEVPFGAPPSLLGRARAYFWDGIRRLKRRMKRA